MLCLVLSLLPETATKQPLPRLSQEPVASPSLSPRHAHPHVDGDGARGGGGVNELDVLQAQLRPHRRPACGGRERRQRRRMFVRAAVLAGRAAASGGCVHNVAAAAVVRRHVQHSPPLQLKAQLKRSSSTATHPRPCPPGHAAG